MIFLGPPTKPTDCNMTTKSPMDKEITDISGSDFIQSTEILVGNNHYDGKERRDQNLKLLHQPDSNDGISVEVSCSPSFDGGLPQTFVLEIRHAISLKLVSKEEKSKPYFRITHLPPETKLSLHLYAYNAKGNSTAVGLETITGKNPHQTQDVKYSFSAGNLKMKMKSSFISIISNSEYLTINAVSYHLKATLSRSSMSRKILCGNRSQIRPYRAYFYSISIRNADRVPCQTHW